MFVLVGICIVCDGRRECLMEWLRFGAHWGWKGVNTTAKHRTYSGIFEVQWRLMPLRYTHNPYDTSMVVYFPQKMAYMSSLRCRRESRAVELGHPYQMASAAPQPRLWMHRRRNLERAGIAT
jgi:hypothetical protein